MSQGRMLLSVLSKNCLLVLDRFLRRLVYILCMHLYIRRSEVFKFVQCRAEKLPVVIERSAVDRIDIRLLVV
jgi:hypothetical protein